VLSDWQLVDNALRVYRQAIFEGSLSDSARQLAGRLRATISLTATVIWSAFGVCVRRKAAKATLILFPLLGLTYLLFLFPPKNAANVAFKYINGILQSTQVWSGGAHTNDARREGEKVYFVRKIMHSLNNARIRHVTGF